jgi:hypothetical protein
MPVIDSMIPVADLDRLAFDLRITNSDCQRGLELLHVLCRRRTDGSLASLTETRIEQSFNERLFAELFGYRTLFRNGKGAYHLQPKVYQHQSGRYSDFSLGTFGPSDGRELVIAELKNPGTNLLAPQGGHYGKASPVDQAFDAARAAPTVKWIIISNFDEMRLYHIDDITTWNGVFLSDTLSLADVRRLLVLFSRQSLIGDGCSSPLGKLRAKESPVIIPQKEGFVRLEQQAGPLPGLDRATRLHQMDSALRKAWTGTRWPPFARDWSTRLESDRLVVETIDDKEVLRNRMEFTSNGVLRFSEYLESTSQSLEASVDAEKVASSIHGFLTFANMVILEAVGGGNIEVSASLHDVAGAHCRARPEWFGPGILSSVKSRVGVTQAPPIQLNMGDSILATQDILLELFFPFEGRSEEGGAEIRRLCPTREQLEGRINSQT